MNEIIAEMQRIKSKVENAQGETKTLMDAITWTEKEGSAMSMEDVKFVLKRIKANLDLALGEAQ